MIQLAYPWALFALLSVPVIILLYSLRPRRRTVLVSTTALWREALRERRHGLGLQKLLRDLSLWLLLLSAIVLTAALAGLQWLGPAAGGDEVVVVIDVSASMQASGADGSRFAAAKRELAGLIDGLSDAGRMAIISSGRDPQLRSAFSGDKDLLRRTLDALQPTDEAGRPRAALALALTLLRHRVRGRVYFLTDGAFDDRVDFASPQVEYRLVGGAAASTPAPRNVAITRFEFRREIGTEQRFQMLLSVRNYTPDPIQTPLRVSLEGRRIYQQTLDLPAEEEQTLVVPFRGRATGYAEAAVDVADDLPLDNRAFAVLAEDEGQRVLLYTPGNFYLEGIFGALPNVRLTLAAEPPDTRLARRARTHDLVVVDRRLFDQVAITRLPAGNYLLIDTLAPGLPFTATGSVAKPAFAGKGASPLVRQLDLSGLKIASARRLRTDAERAGLQRLFWSEETDLALALIDDDVRLIYLGFDLTASNFPLQAAFPVFINNSLDWLLDRAENAGFSATQLAAGERFSFAVPGPDSAVIVTTSTGAGLIQTVDPQRLRVSFDATHKVGIYRYTVDQIERRFAVNLTDEQESDIRPRVDAPPAAAAARPAAAVAGAQAALVLWPYAALIALALLTLEWVLWCARRGSA